MAPNCRDRQIAILLFVSLCFIGLALASGYFAVQAFAAVSVMESRLRSAEVKLDDLGEKLRKQLQLHGRLGENNEDVRDRFDRNEENISACRSEIIMLERQLANAIDKLKQYSLSIGERRFLQQEMRRAAEREWGG